MKNNKGITLIALIITIIVILILAVITINMVIGEGGIIERAKTAIRNHKIAEVKEMLYTDLNSRYNAVIGRNMEDETVQAIAELSVDYDILPEKFSVHYKVETVYKPAVEFILLRIDMNIEKEEKILEDYIVDYVEDDNKKSILISRGDYDEDGFITNKDYTILKKISNVNLGYGEKEVEHFDYCKDGRVDINDLPIFNAKYGLYSEVEE